MLKYCYNFDDIFKFINDNELVIVAYGQCDWLESLEDDVKYIHENFIFVEMCERIAIDMQIIKFPQFRIYKNGNELLQIIGKHSISQVLETCNQLI